MKLTIFTPIYNRAHLIHRLYESLLRQSNQNFVWLIVDDGSTDDIKQTVERYKVSANFEIRYYYQKNQGKHIAHNTGVEKCDTELFFCVDSDDYLTDDAVEKIYSIYNSKAYTSSNTLGYYFRKMDTDGKLSGGKFSLRGNLVGLREIYYRYGFVGELAIVLKTKMIKHFCFPSYDGEKFVSEKVFYNQITSIAPMVYTDDPIYIFEYQDNGYTINSNRLLAKNPKGAAMGFLSDAIYGTNLLDMTKAYASFSAVKKVFGISNGIYPQNNRVKPIVRMLSVLLKFHYNKLFRRIDLKYNKEEK